MNKQICKFNNKPVYLLGADSGGIYYWLQSSSWDCGWYWGFGYIETYTNNKYPRLSRDIGSHQHATDFYPEWWGHNKAGYKPSILAETTFSDHEGWLLSELFEQFYLLKDMAGFYARGNCNIASDAGNIAFVRPEMVTVINKEWIPDVVNKILTILSPGGKIDE